MTERDEEVYLTDVLRSVPAAVILSNLPDSTVSFTCPFCGKTGEQDINRPKTPLIKGKPPKSKKKNKGER